MSVAANITAPQSTQSGNFNVTITFASPVTGVSKTIITITAVSGNGTTGVIFDVTGSGATYNVPFQLPEDVAGSLQIAITGQVMVSGVLESVTATARTVAYDNITNVNATFGTVTYRDGGVIAVPVTFAKAVIAPARSIFQLTRVSGDYLEGVAYRLVGEGTAYTLIIEVPPDKKGSLQVACHGYVLQADTRLWDDITCTAITVTYNMRVPRFNVERPSVLRPGINDVFYDFEELAWKIDSTQIEIEGIAVTPDIYRAVATDTRPDAPVPVGSGWAAAVDGHTEHARFYLLRFDVPASLLPGGFDIIWDAGAIETVPSVI